MTTVVASHTGSLTPASNPWTFVGSVTWDSGIGGGSGGGAGFGSGQLGGNGGSGIVIVRWTP